MTSVLPSVKAPSPSMTRVLPNNTARAPSPNKSSLGSVPAVAGPHMATVSGSAKKKKKKKKAKQLAGEATQAQPPPEPPKVVATLATVNSKLPPMQLRPMRMHPMLKPPMPMPQIQLPPMQIPPMQTPPSLEALSGHADPETKAISDLCIAWFNTGYNTGLYQGLKRKRGAETEQMRKRHKTGGKWNSVIDQEEEKPAAPPLPPAVAAARRQKQKTRKQKAAAAAARAAARASASASASASAPAQPVDISKIATHPTSPSRRRKYCYWLKKRKQQELKSEIKVKEEPTSDYPELSVPPLAVQIKQEPPE